MDDPLLGMDLTDRAIEFLQKIDVPHQVRVYNIEVDQHHNYFVGAEGYLVHNKMSFGSLFGIGGSSVFTDGLTTVFVGSLYEETNDHVSTAVFMGSTRVATVRDGFQHFYHSDHLGGLNIRTNGEGFKQEEVWYEPYGKISYHDYFGSAAEIASYYYTDQYLDQETELYFYNARYYDPELGRFTQADTIVPDPNDTQNYNRYTYVLNNPLKYVDPSGHTTSFYSWSYEDWNYFSSWEDDFNLFERELGALVGGAGEVALGLYAGGLFSWTGIGSVLGGITFAHGMDHAVAGWSTSWTGERHRTATSQGFQLMGASEGVSDWLDAGVGGIFTAASGITVSNALRQQASNTASVLDKTLSSLDDVSIHKNSNSYIGHQAIYEIEMDSVLFKYGKADMTNMSKSGFPVRLQSQLNRLNKIFSGSDITGRIIYEHPSISTYSIKQIEISYIKKMLHVTGELSRLNPGHSFLLK